MRPFFACIGLCAACVTIAGCATTSDAQKQVAVRPLWKSPSAFAKEQAAAKEKEKAEPKVAEAKTSNPFRKDATAAKSGESEKSTAKPDEKAKSVAAGEKASKDPEAKPFPATERAVETASAAKTSDSDSKSDERGGTKPNGAFSPETLKLIDAELADAPPEERAYWYDQLKRVDPAVIPQILQARRLTAEVVQQRQQDAWNDPEERDPIEPKSNRGKVRTADIREFSAENASAAHAGGRQFPGGKSALNHALHESDGMSTRQQIVQQGYTTPESEAPSTRSPYAVQKTPTANSTPPAAPPATLLNPSTGLNAISRLLPSGRTGIAQSSANSPAAVSLLTPTELDQNAAWPSQLDSLISQLEADVAQLRPGSTDEAQTEYIRRHVHLRLLYLMAEHPERALTAIPGIDSADQEFWQQMIWSMANYFDAEHLPAAKDRAGQAVAQLATATQRLRERAGLEIRNLAFCREIVYYGNFVRFPRDEFHPGDDALLYAEIENFKSELTVDGLYRTLLRSTAEIISPSGEVHWHKEFSAAEAEDLCLNYRRDYFLNYRITIPNRLPLGPHSLKLTVFDELSGKVVSQSINFVVR